MTAAHSTPQPHPVSPEPLWRPGPDRVAGARITRFQAWAAEHHGAPAAVPGDPEASYAALHRWSVEELTSFWQALTEWFDVRFSAPYETVLAGSSMPGAEWFPGAKLNYAEHALRTAEDPARVDDPALLHVDEEHEPSPVTWGERLARSWVGLRAMRSYALATMDVEGGGRAAGKDNVSKLLWANWHRDLGELAMDVMGKAGMAMRDGDFDEWQRLYLFSRADTIYGGSNEIQRNIIAERVLGLPREVKG